MASPTSPSFTFPLKSTPFVHDPPGAQEFYEHMGRVMTIWGRFELSFTNDLAFGLSGLPNVEALFNPFPRMLGRKLDAYSKCFSKINELRHYEDSVRQFVAAVKSTAKKRDIIAHGSFWAFTTQEPLTAEFTMIDIKNGTIKTQRFHCTLQEMKEIVIEADNLNTRYVILSSAVGQICNAIKMKTARKAE